MCDQNQTTILEVSNSALDITAESGLNLEPHYEGNDQFFSTPVKKRNSNEFEPKFVPQSEPIHTQVIVSKEFKPKKNI